MAQIDKAAGRATSLTQQLLTFARRQKVAPEVISLNDLVDDMAQLLRRLIGEDIELLTVLDEKLWPVCVDVSQTQQVLTNMAVNARDAMPEGGLLTLDTSNVCLDGEVSGRTGIGLSVGDYVVLSITDTGLGMDWDTRKNIFEPFFTTKERGKGSGLGLSICYGVIKQAGGDIMVESEFDRGSVFKIFLPRAAGEPTRPGRADDAAESAPVRGTESLLVVDDEPQVLRMVTETLRALGYDVRSASGGSEALEIARTHPIDLLLTDVVMPRLNGRELARQILDELPNVKVLYMSGNVSDTPEWPSGGSEEGKLLRKPFAPADLASRVREALDSES